MHARSAPTGYCPRRPTPREIVAYFAAISDGVDLPLMVYNRAHGAVVEITWETAVELTRIDRVVAIKDSSMHTAQTLATIEGDLVRVFGGFISRLGLAVLRGLGGDGNTDGGGLGAKFAVAFYEAFWHNDFAGAEQGAGSYQALMTCLVRPD
jgi:1-pyrroline-4-hydroxy-2-carboxylate deaminase